MIEDGKGWSYVLPIVKTETLPLMKTEVKFSEIPVPI